jgi:hypothetical protein
MKIKHLQENLTPASTPSVKTIPPEFGRSNEMLESGAGTTGAGAVASVSSPVGGMQRRGKGSMFQGIKTSAKYPNSAAVKEEAMGTFAALKGLKTWQVVIFNNYYAGKYSDYRGRYYYVLATSPQEAKQVVLDNADGILQELLAMKSHNGKKILPRGSAVRITSDRIGKIEDGTVAGRMSTAGFKKMFGPQGPVMVKLSGGAVVDMQDPVVQGSDLKTVAKADLGSNSMNLPSGYGDVVQPQKVSEEHLDEIFNPTSGVARFLRAASAFAGDYIPVAIGAAGTFAATTAVLGPVAAMMASSTVGSQILQTIQNQQNKVPGVIQQMVEKYFGSEQEEVEFALIHAKAAFLGQREFRWRGQQWPVTLEKNAAEAIVEKNDRYWLEQQARQQQQPAFAEAKKAANTKTVRHALSKRPPAKLSDKEQEKKKSESDAAWERLMAYAAAQEKEVDEARVGNRMSDISVGSPKIVNYKGKAVGEVGIDHEPSPGNGPYYWKHYLTGKYMVGYDTKQEALADLKHLVMQNEGQQGVAEAGEWTKLPNGNWRNMHTGAQQSTPPKTKKPRRTMGLNASLEQHADDKMKELGHKFKPVKEGSESDRIQALYDKLERFEERLGSDDPRVQALKDEIRGLKDEYRVVGQNTANSLRGVTENSMADFFAKAAQEKFPNALVRKNGETIQEPPKREVPPALPKTPVDVPALQQQLVDLEKRYEQLGGDSWQYADRMMDRDREAQQVGQQIRYIKQQLANAGNQLDEKSKSQAQFRTMAAVAHNPKFAKKVGIKQSVGKEFHKADKGVNYKSLPKKVDEAEISEEMLASELYKDFQIFSKGKDKAISGKAKSKDLSGKPKDKEIIAKVTKMANEDKDPCWNSYKQVGMKKKNGKTVPNCVPKK